jgi:hypothetical protein
MRDYDTQSVLRLLEFATACVHLAIEYIDCTRIHSIECEKTIDQRFVSTGEVVKRPMDMFISSYECI